MSSTRSIKTLGLAGLMAVMAMMVVAAVGAASASATEPVYSKSKVCTHAATAFTPAFTKGSVWWFNNSACTSHTATTKPSALGAGEYGYSPFYSESGASRLVTVAGHEVTCEHDFNVGELTGPKSDRVAIEFTGCVAIGPLGVKLPCKSVTPGAPAGAAGEIATNVLKSTLYYIKGTHATTKEVAIGLEPETAALFTEFKCEGSGVTELIKVGNKAGSGKGSLVCPITPTNTPGTKYTLACKQKSGVQEPTEYEKETSPESGTWEKVVDYLESEATCTGFGCTKYTWQQSGQESTDSITTAETGEIKA